MASGLAAGLLAAALGGCSGKTVAGELPDDESPESAAATVRRAAEVLVGSGSSRVRTTMEMATGGTRVAIRGGGTYDFARRVGRLRLVLPEDARGDAEHEPITELFAAGALFMRNRGAGVPPAKWVRVDTAGVSDGNLVSGGATDPLAAAELLRGARRVAVVGDELLDGVAVRHYRGTADIGRAARWASPAVRGQLAAAVRGLPRTEVPFDAYLDGDGRLRKVRHRFAVTGGRAEGGGDPEPDTGATESMGERGRSGSGGVGAEADAGGTAGAGQAAEGSGGAPEGASGPVGAARILGVVSTTELYDFGVPVTVSLPESMDIYTGKVGSPRK